MVYDREDGSMLKHTNLILGAIRTTTMNCGANLNGFKTLVNNKLSMVKKGFIPKIYQSASAPKTSLRGGLPSMQIR